MGYVISEWAHMKLQTGTATGVYKLCLSIKTYWKTNRISKVWLNLGWNLATEMIGASSIDNSYCCSRKMGEKQNGAAKTLMYDYYYVS